MPRPQPARPAVALPSSCLLFALTGLFVQWAVRLDYGPDEPYHLEYVHILATSHRLPSRTETYLGQHPPLYYVLMTAPWNLVGGEREPLSVAPGPDALGQMDAPAARAAASFAPSHLLLPRSPAGPGPPRCRPRHPAPWQPPLIFPLPPAPCSNTSSGVVNNENASILCSTVVCLALVTAGAGATAR